MMKPTMFIVFMMEEIVVDPASMQRCVQNVYVTQEMRYLIPPKMQKLAMDTAMTNITLMDVIMMVVTVADFASTELIAQNVHALAK